MKKIILILFLINSVPLMAEQNYFQLSKNYIVGQKATWDTFDTICELTYLGFCYADMKQTLDIKNHKRLFENNILLGHHPSDKNIKIYFASIAVIQPIIAYMLPKRYRASFNGFTIGVEWMCVWGNYNRGLSANIMKRF